uniref:Uncharacterized protein n=1 Tax=Megaselia scalaris TaxID=36166 RepID=T1GKU5_MEGSC
MLRLAPICLEKHQDEEALPTRSHQLSAVPSAITLNINEHSGNGVVGVKKTLSQS